ncbi:MAG: S9 family peptidase [Gammaproteobacteria bacterium]|uniref:S9 family peptidase n=1 Tax=SAR86 cluster bacterium TaxID=2030880 RepID=A0A520MYJ5_9GAMM|nr:S9 family peptidase [Gammaproteobacteria bacterium]MBA4729707.1 S9 family peptidase [SAR86 cluster bacterium]RPG35053.1 MAG: S9 family peptidase [Gammaproteobacteria bacterium TMED193]RZO26305.1 MAG: S9 family peptidase [SAR86 cluster bacterium]
MSNNDDNKMKDPYLWLEDVEGKEALQWVESQNELTKERYSQAETFDETYNYLLDDYNSVDRIPFPSIRGQYIYNFWRDKNNIRGIWRRTSLESYQNDAPEWETIIDVDLLANEENKNWVWRGANCLGPDFKKCLVSLSDGGKDASVLREYDIETKTFVEDGFFAPEAKQYSDWINEDQVLIATDFGEGTLNESGYARQVRIWNRGDNLLSSEILFEGGYQDIFSFPFSEIRPDGNYFGVLEGPTFFTKILHLYSNDKLIKVDLPLKVDIYGTYQNLLLISIAEEWLGFAIGSLLAVNIEDALAQNITSKSVKMLFEPTDTSFLRSVSIGKDQILVNTLDNIKGKITHFKKIGKTWFESNLRGFDEDMLSISASDSWSNIAFIGSESFTQPTGLYFSKDSEEFKKIKSLPRKFDPSVYEVNQFFSQSKDGTEIPYFQISRNDMVLNSSNPTLLYGYGGFEISLTPSYLSAFSRKWLDQGGVYVIANIRGGGEYGPKWHQSALKANRQRAYDDFISIAEDLISKGVTSPKNLGIRGGSNGGLLVGAVVTQRPDLFNAVICAVPLLDMYRYDKLLAGASWVDEYGDPDNEDEWEFIKKYSPYQNVFPNREYPEIYFYTSTKDDRVHPGHARKMAKKMLDQGHKIIYYENVEGGHSAASNYEQSAFMSALQLEYLNDKLKK